MESHTSFSKAQTWTLDANATGLSKLHVMTSVQLGSLSLWQVSGDPHRPQKLRVTDGEERNSSSRAAPGRPKSVADRAADSRSISRPGNGYRLLGASVLTAT